MQLLTVGEWTYLYGQKTQNARMVIREENQKMF